MMKKAADLSNYAFPNDVSRVLLDRATGISISEDVFMAAAWNRS